MLESPASTASSHLSSSSSSFSEISLLENNRVSKTEAFFSSPFSTRPPSPDSQVPLTTRSTPIPLSRLFPSRYTVDSPTRKSKPNFLFDELSDIPFVSSPTTDNSTPKPLAPSLALPIDVAHHSQDQYIDLDLLSPGSIIRPPSPSNSFSSLPSSRSHSYRSQSSSLHDPLQTFPSPTTTRFSPPSSIPASFQHNQIQTQNHNITLKLQTSLGHGAFSSVWLAVDESTPPLEPDTAGHPKDPADKRVVAVKMTPRSGGDQDRRRTMTSFIREVEVLRHISHPNITPLLAHLTTPTHHVLVLPYVSGGDLLGLVNSDEAHGALGENTLRRIWCELCKAVGWMHGVGLVHRDVKLENVLLTSPTTSLSAASPASPLIKLTDFGLSRFIDPASPLLSTRCGSEAYAAPELVIGGRRYDGRETDAWACGVVLFALVGRGLPFGEGVRGGRGWARIKGDVQQGEEGGYAGYGRAGEGERRSWLMRIARGEYTWPAPVPVHEPELVSVSETENVPVTEPSPGKQNVTENETQKEEGRGELRGPRLVESEGAKRIVERLLVRDPGKRARISELWGDEWMGGVGSSGEEGSVRVREGSVGAGVVGNGEGEEGREEVERAREENVGVGVGVGGEGILVDREGIDRIACEEVV